MSTKARGKGVAVAAHTCKDGPAVVGRQACLQSPGCLEGCLLGTNDSAQRPQDRNLDLLELLRRHAAPIARPIEHPGVHTCSGERRPDRDLEPLVGPKCGDQGLRLRCGRWSSGG